MQQYSANWLLAVSVIPIVGSVIAMEMISPSNVVNIVVVVSVITDLWRPTTGFIRSGGGGRAPI